MNRTRVGLLRGGPSSEYDFSLRTGAAIQNALPDDLYDVRDIYIDKQGMWHARGMPTDPSRALQQIDVVINALHGGVGEDGTVQRIIERIGVPYVGSDPLPSGLSYNKIRAREILHDAGIEMPRAVSFGLGTGLNTAEMSMAVFEQFAAPYVIKPANEGSSHGIRIATTILELPDGIGDVLDEFGTALIEELVRGEEVQVGIIEGFRTENLYALPPAVIVRPDGARTVERQHLVDGVQHLVPSPFSHGIKQELMDAARAAHIALGLSHLSSAGFILTPRGPVLLEVDSLPHLHEQAAFPAMLKSVGASLRELVEHLIQVARRG